MSIKGGARRAEPASLQTRASRALGWSFLNTVVGRLGTLAIGIALARLLGPEQFGTFAIASVALMAVLSFNELGVSLAIVRWEDDPRTIAPTVATISIGMSLVLVAAMWLAAPAFASAMGDPEATLVVQLMSFAVLINGIVAAPAALLQRNFAAGRRMAADQVNTWLGAGMSLLLAVFGLGALSLAIGRLAGSLVSAVMLLAWSPLPFRLGFDKTVGRQLLHFGLPLAGASAVVFASGFADQLVVGSTLGAVALGFYVLAFNLSSWPVSIFSQPLRAVAPALFARLQHSRDEQHRAFYAIAGLLAAVALPVCAVLAGAADPLVRLVYGQDWAPASAVLLWLGAVAGLRILFELSYDFLVVRGQTRAILTAQIVWLALSIPAFLLGGRWNGLAGIAMAQLIVAGAVVAPLYLWLLRRSGLSLRRLLGSVALPLLASAAVGVGAWFMQGFVRIDLLACALGGLLGLTAVAVLVYPQRAHLTLLRGAENKSSARSDGMPATPGEKAVQQEGDG